MTRWVIIACLLLSIIACTGNTSGNDAEQSPYMSPSADANPHFDLPDIQQNGELIVLTLYGPESYFEFRGEDFGVQYMIAREYAKSIGASVRVEVARNQNDLIQKLLCGEGDMVSYAMSISDSLEGQIAFVGEGEIDTFLDSLSRQRNDVSLHVLPHSAWAVRKDSPELLASLQTWMTAHAGDFSDYTTIRLRTHSGRTYQPRRHVAAPILNAAAGQISRYDAYFKRYALHCGWDWRLLAAQAYQESGFDPEAVSYMGAMGLMQLMPGTAHDMGVDQSKVFDAQHNVRGAVKLIQQLSRHYADIADGDERINFILAAYNAGPGHVDDARALARKYGRDPNVWAGNVDGFVLKMSDSKYYNQPEAAHGYFRGRETYNYVGSIQARWREYRRKITR